MPLLGREDLAKNLLEGAEQHFKAQVLRLESDIDNLVANSVGIDDHQRIDNALVNLVEELARHRDNLETLQEFRNKRSL